jgi:hypothetical protein
VSWVHVQRDFHIPFVASSQGLSDLCGSLSRVLGALVVPFCLGELVLNFFLGALKLLLFL